MKQLFFLLCCFPLSLFASLQEELFAYLEDLNTYSVLHKNEIYESQRAGEMIGGSASCHKPLETQLVKIELPKFDAGCGGIDIFSGGISFISHDQFIAALKNIASAAQGYAFMLGIETVSPTIASTMKQMETWANHINSLGINSCEIATGLVGSVWPKKTAAKQHICRMAKRGGFASSYINARHQCADEGDYEETLKKIAGDPLFNDLLLEEYNLAWKAIQKHPFLSKKENQKFAEEIMSLTGTLIIKKDQHLAIEHRPSRMYDSSFFQILLEGGRTKMYQCMGKNKKQECLAVEERELILSFEESWKGRIQKALEGIQQKILFDQSLSDQEIDLLSKSRFPLFKIVSVLTAYKQQSNSLSLYEIAQMVGVEMLIQYLREIIGQMRLAAIQLEKGQMYDFESKDFVEELDRIEKIINRYEEKNDKRLEMENQLLLKIQKLEQKIASQMILF